MTPQNIGIAVWLLIKLMVLLGFGIYIIFAGVILRQEQLMSKTIEEDSEKILSILTWLHFAASILIFALALLIL